MILKKIRYYSNLLTALFLFASCLVNPDNSKKDESLFNLSTRINSSISRAVDFLDSVQLDYGEFSTYLYNIDSGDLHFDSSPFVTTFVLYSIKDVDNNKLDSMRIRALNFLSSEEESGGVWRYWSSRNSYKSPYPDADDISTVSFILKMYSIPFTNNVSLLEKNRDSTGLFYTWIEDPRVEHEVDCVVNSNVLLYLGDKYPKVCDYINNVVENGDTCSLYYTDRLALYYMVSRAVENGINGLRKSSDIIISEVLKRRLNNNSFGTSIQTALSIVILINLGYSGDEILPAIEYLLEQQNNNGSWERGVFYVNPTSNWGSKELTTGFAIEALNKYKILHKN